MNFRVGQRVVCVDDANFTHKDNGATIHKGQVYVVRGLAREENGPGLYLEGVFQRARRGGPFDGEELAWKANRFRPVVERKTDISTFTQILDDVSAGRVRELEGVR
jgi:hypothetical protein